MPNGNSPPFKNTFNYVVSPGVPEKGACALEVVPECIGKSTIQLPVPVHLKFQGRNTYGEHGLGSQHVTVNIHFVQLWRRRELTPCIQFQDGWEKNTHSWIYADGVVIHQIDFSKLGKVSTKIL